MEIRWHKSFEKWVERRPVEIAAQDEGRYNHEDITVSLNSIASHIFKLNMQ